jgi:hypothetical protein
MITTTDAPLMVRNTHAGPAVFQYGKDQENFVEWAGAGDGNGGDVQAVPSALLNNPQFRKMLVLGVYVVEDDPTMAAEVENAHRTSWETRQAEQQNASAASIDIAPDNDFIVSKCIAHVTPYKVCDADVSVRARDRFEEPPLCPEHKSHAKDYVPKGTGRLVGNQSEMVWEKVRVADRVRQQKSKGDAE